ncbi:hypothetical protein HSBAA_PA_3920 (plasmid) [Vreelandella sulfidaeris]|uniref:Uncharacterized protein n=1 Tax=Vreelandella sulfidaeris TaxID=115553 RepID=A0A455UNI2_9GAMM|nr:hypothetical protein HSBAA_PA_3920 [Halomonas sulfidaeris]
MEIPATVTGNMLFQFASLMGLKISPDMRQNPITGCAIGAPRCESCNSQNRVVTSSWQVFLQGGDIVGIGEMGHFDYVRMTVPNAS